MITFVSPVACTCASALLLEGNAFCLPVQQPTGNFLSPIILHFYRAPGDWEHNLHDRCILKLSEEHVLEMFVVLAETLGETAVAEGCEGIRHSITLCLMECFYHIYRLETVDDLQAGAAAAGKNTSTSDGKQDDNKEKKNRPLSQKEILAQRLKAAAQKQKDEDYQASRGMSSRHSRFGTMIMEKRPLQGGRMRIVSNVFKTEHTLPTDLYAKEAGKKPLPDPQPRIYLDPHVAEILLQTADQLFKDGGYNALMTVALRQLNAEKSLFLPEDCITYFWLAGLMMGIYRSQNKRRIKRMLKKKEKKANDSTSDETFFDGSSVEATLNGNAFEYLFKKIELCFQMKPIQYEHLAPCISYYKEIVITLSRTHGKKHDARPPCTRSGAFWKRISTMTITTPI